MSAVTTVLFDLDGTLTDPVEGITRCIEYAVLGMGCECPPRDELACYIGPPLRPTFAGLLNTDDAALVESALAKYRERFSTVGLFENEVYPGIDDMLARLAGTGMQMFIATSKPAIYARRIVAHFELDGYFEAVYGSEIDGTRDSKTDLLNYLVQQESLAPGQCVMVGDREHDILAARNAGMQGIGVTYGFGSREELLEAGAVALCDTPAEIPDAISRLRALP